MIHKFGWNEGELAKESYIEQLEKKYAELDKLYLDMGEQEQQACKEIARLKKEAIADNSLIKQLNILVDELEKQVDFYSENNGDGTLKVGQL